MPLRLVSRTSLLFRSISASDPTRRRWAEHDHFKVLASLKSSTARLIISSQTASNGLKTALSRHLCFTAHFPPEDPAIALSTSTDGLTLWSCDHTISHRTVRPEAKSKTAKKLGSVSARVSVEPSVKSEDRTSVGPVEGTLSVKVESFE